MPKLLSPNELASLLSQLRQSLAVDMSVSISKSKSRRDRCNVAAKTVVLDRALTEQESAIAKWLLLHSTPPATDFLPQLDVAHVSGLCGCGCPTVYLEVPEATPRARVRKSPIEDAIGEVNGSMVGIKLLQRDGHLTCLELYDLDEIEHPYPLPDLNSLRPF